MKIFLKYKFLLFFFIVVKLAGKTPSEIQNPLVVEKNKQAPRSTFFNFEFPDNYFHVRAPLFSPPEGVLDEAEIHARIASPPGIESTIDSSKRRVVGDGRVDRNLPRDLS